MGNSNDPKTLANFIHCLSLLENNASLLYRDIANKVELPLVKSLFLEIATDSLKHSTILKGISETIAPSEKKTRDCEKKIGEAWCVIEGFQREISEKNKISGGELAKLSEKLTVLESLLGEEYYMFVQMKTLQFMIKEINQIYSIDLGSVKKLFTNIIRDEDTHRELLETIRDIIEKKEKAKADNAPAVRYEHPDSWNTPLPPTS